MAYDKFFGTVKVTVMTEVYQKMKESKIKTNGEGKVVKAFQLKLNRNRIYGPQASDVSTSLIIIYRHNEDCYCLCRTKTLTVRPRSLRRFRSRTPRYTPITDTLKDLVTSAAARRQEPQEACRTAHARAHQHTSLLVWRGRVRV